MAKDENEKFAAAMGETFKELRIKKGFSSYEKFAVEYEFDRKQYWRLEKGCNCNIFSIRSILKIHGLRTDEFFTEVEKKFKKINPNH
jgi:hypothetical protein